MYIGIAGGLLVFTGLWHVTEWMMDGRRTDTWRLVPFGIVYAILGCLLVTGGGGIVQIIALFLAATGGAFAFITRNTANVRKWVIWAFILMDVIIVVCLILALLG